MPVQKQEKSRHSLRAVERTLLAPVNVETLRVGDVFVRAGTACMMVNVNPKPTDIEERHVPIVNLTSGSVWWIPATEQVFPCFDVALEFRSARRQD